MAPHSSTLAWKIPWTEEPGRLQSMGSLRVGHGWATSLSCIGEGNGNPLQCSCLENPRDGGAWWAAVCGVTQSRTWLKRLSSSSSFNFRVSWTSSGLSPSPHLPPSASSLSPSLISFLSVLPSPFFPSFLLSFQHPVHASFMYILFSLISLKSFI